MLKQNDWHIRQMPILTYVASFDFMTRLTLEQCYQKLSEVAKESPRRGKTNVYEVSRDHNKELFFAAKYALNQSAWYLAVHLKSEGSQSQVSCYTGIPVSTFIIPFIFLTVVLILVGIANQLSVTALILLFVAILIVTGLVGIRYVQLFRRVLESDIRALLSDK